MTKKEKYALKDVIVVESCREVKAVACMDPYIVLAEAIVKANNEEDPELPVVGNIAKSIFGKKIDE